MDEEGINDEEGTSETMADKSCDTEEVIGRNCNWLLCRVLNVFGHVQHYSLCFLSSSELSL